MGDKRRINSAERGKEVGKTTIKKHAKADRLKKRTVHYNLIEERRKKRDK